MKLHLKRGRELDLIVVKIKRSKRGEYSRQWNLLVAKHDSRKGQTSVPLPFGLTLEGKTRAQRAKAAKARTAARVERMGRTLARIAREAEPVQVARTPKTPAVESETDIWGQPIDPRGPAPAGMPRAERLAAQARAVERARESARPCGQRTADGTPCKRRLLPGTQCPAPGHHGLRSVS